MIEKVIVLRSEMDEDKLVEFLSKLPCDVVLKSSNFGADENGNTSSASSSADSALEFQELKIIPEFRQVYQGQNQIELTQREYDTLLLLASYPGFVYTKAQIYQYIHSKESIVDIDNTIYCLIHGLRKKLELDPRHPKYVVTVRGVGYKFAMNQETH